MNTKHWLVTAAAVTMAASTMLAQKQIASLSSSTQFYLRGAAVHPSPGIPSWPVVSGDSFAAGDTPLELVLPDDSTIVLAPKTTASLGASGDVTVVRIETGSVHYTLKPDTRVTFQCKDSKIAIKGLTGEAHCGSKIPAGWWATGGGLTGGVAGVALSRGNGPPVSPTECNNGRGRGNGQPACP